jgi:hypothetical protein
MSLRVCALNAKHGAKLANTHRSRCASGFDCRGIGATSPGRGTVGTSDTRQFLVLAALGFAAAGCTCERKTDAPFTPFGVATAVRAESTTTLASSDVHDAGQKRSFKKQTATTLTPPNAIIRVGPWQVQAPEGALFTSYLLMELDAVDGPEVVASVVRGDASGSTTGRTQPTLMLLQQGQAPKPLAPFPTFVPTGPACELSTTLRSTGPTTVTWDVEAHCNEPTLTRAPTRSISVIAPLSARPIRLHLRLAPPPRSEAVALTIDTADIDADGHDDAEVTFELTSGSTDAAIAPSSSAQDVSASLVWFDRAAGMARDPAQPQSMFLALSNDALAMAKGPTTSRDVAGRINLSRRLFAYLCKEGAAYRVTDSDGSALPCGDLRTAFEQFAQAEVTAALTQKNFARALLAFEQAAWFGTGISEAMRKNLEKQLRNAVPSRNANVRALSVKVSSPNPGPHFAPLRYLNDVLLIATPNGVWRWTADQLSDASDEYDPWPLLVFSPGGQRLTQVTYRCDEPTVSATAQTAAGLFETVLTTDVLSARPGLCEGKGVAPDTDFRPVAWSQEGLSAFLGPVQLGAPSHYRQPGSPLSPSGSFAITQTKLGLLVLGPTSAELWNLPNDTPPLGDCVIADSGLRAACVDSTRVIELNVPR